jgi:long-chain acyl-CoA synthetase
MTAVPRLYEVLRERILRDMAKASGTRARLFWSAVALGRKKYESPELMTLPERLLDRAVDRIVRGKMRARFGGRLKALVSGGAPLNYEIGVFFTALGLRLLQGYGQTEAAPVVSCNRVHRVKLRSVGPPLKGVEVRIADDGEILVRGGLVMQGYWNQPKLTAAVLRDGWLHTGDVGVIDQDGFLQITDRKKDIIVLSGGDTLSPLRIESNLALEPEIDVAVAFGDNRPHIVAIIVPGQAFADDWAKRNGVESSLPALAANPDFVRAVGAAVDRANLRLSPTERVKRFIVADRGFTTENGMMTPTMKPRRHEVARHWGAVIAGLY